METDQTQMPVSHELWYTAQMAMRDKIEQLSTDIRDTKNSAKSTNDLAQKILIQATTTNGRVTSMEKWIVDATKTMSDISTKVSSNSSSITKIWAGVAVLVFVGGILGTLSMSVLNTKIKDGIQEYMVANTIKVDK